MFWLRAQSRRQWRRGSPASQSRCWGVQPGPPASSPSMIGAVMVTPSIFLSSSAPKTLVGRAECQLVAHTRAFGIKAIRPGSPLTMALALWIILRTGLACDNLSRSVATGWPQKAKLWQNSTGRHPEVSNTILGFLEGGGSLCIPRPFRRWSEASRYQRARRSHRCGSNRASHRMSLLKIAMPACSNLNKGSALHSSTSMAVPPVIMPSPMPIYLMRA